MENRVCQYCFTSLNLRIIESECHFLVKCPKYDELRDKYLQGFRMFNFANEDILPIMLSSNNETDIANIALFL